MKVVITHLKAPWPAGAKPGDVVELAGDAVPAWALGKCRPASDDEVEAAQAAEAKAAEDAQIAASLAAAEQQAAEERAAAEAKAAGKKAATKG